MKNTIKVPPDAMGPLFQEPTECWEMKLPKVLGFESKCFDSKTFHPESFSVKDQNGGEVKKYLPSTNMIRWKYVEGEGKETSEIKEEEKEEEFRRDSLGVDVKTDTNQAIETNARIVHWSDGSKQLFLGDEAFNINVQDEDYSVIFEKYGDILIPKCPIKKKALLKPASLSSKFHMNIFKAMNESLEEKEKEKHRTSIYGLGKDLEEKMNIKLDMEELPKKRGMGMYGRGEEENPTRVLIKRGKVDNTSSGEENEYAQRRGVIIHTGDDDGNLGDGGHDHDDDGGHDDDDGDDDLF